MENLSELVLMQFQIKARRINKEKSHYVLNTDKGRKIVKKTFDPISHILFQHEIKEHLYNRDFVNIDRFNLSAEGKPFVQLGETVYVMTDLLEYDEIDFSLNEDMLKATQTLAKFHTASENIEFEGNIFYETENTVKSFKKGLTELVIIKKGISSQKKLSDFDVLFLKNYEYYLQQASDSINLLEKTNSSKLEQLAKNKNLVCHNSLKEENILKADSIYITNFSQASICHSIFDFCKLIQRYIKNMPLEYLPFSQILEQYNKYKPISSEEMEILIPILKYPQKYIKICSRHYSKKRNWTPSAIANQMETVIKNRTALEQYINT